MSWVADLPTHGKCSKCRRSWKVLVLSVWTERLSQKLSTNAQCVRGTLTWPLHDWQQVISEHKMAEVVDCKVQLMALC